MVRITGWLIHPGREKQGSAMVEKLGDLLSQHKGFVSRLHIQAPRMPQEVATITVWEDEESANAAANSESVLALMSQMVADDIGHPSAVNSGLHALISSMP
ncbi:MAG: antibiotic biosynthesis monooxygenase [Chloroflexi bacterium]|nr:antibiotic biosynthesis monooxygenase [Chloroflexota bacterium]